MQQAAVSEASSTEFVKGAAQDRLVSLDVLRGLTIAGMILVTDPGTYSFVYSPLRHAEWMGATATDMIFPCFLFIVGVSLTLSFAARLARGDSRGRLAGHLLRRAAILFVLGLALNAFPDLVWETLRLPGILQRIAVCSLLAGLLYLAATGAASERGREGRSRAWVLAGTAVVLLAGYWALLKLVPVPGLGAGRLDTFGNLPAYLDRTILGTKHMWKWGLTPGMGVTYDSEGFLSTLPALANVLVGMLAGDWMRTAQPGRRKALGLAAAGLLLVMLGLALNPLLPINKRIWTSTFALYSSGVSLLLFSFFYAVVDLWRVRWGMFPALVLGTNAILAFAISTIITTLSDRIHVGGAGSLTLHRWGYQRLFATWLSPIHASLAYAIAIVLLNVALLLPLYRRRIFLRV